MNTDMAFLVTPKYIKQHYPANPGSSQKLKYKLNLYNSLLPFQPWADTTIRSAPIYYYTVAMVFPNTDVYITCVTTPV